MDHLSLSRRAWLALLGAGGTVAGTGVAAETDAVRTVTRQSPPETLWERTYGNTDGDTALGIAAADEGYAVAGGVRTDDDQEDGWLFRVDTDGEQQWVETFGGGGREWFSDVIATPDGYLAAGQTTSIGNGKLDAWLVKTDRDGNLEWEEAYGNIGDERAMSVSRVGSDGYLFVGGTTSEGAGEVDAWMGRVGPTGSMRWNKVFGDTGTDWPQDHAHLSDGYLLAGRTDSTGDTEPWVVRVDEGEDGQPVWSETYGGSDLDYARAVVADGEGGGVFAGGTQSSGAGGTDALVVAIDGDGTERWRKTLGESGDDRVVDLVQAGDGYLLVGSTAGSGGQSTWVVRLGPGGSLEWEQTVGTNEEDYANAVATGSDQHVVAGDVSDGTTNDGRLVAIPGPKSPYEELKTEHLEQARRIEEISITPFGHEQRVLDTHDAFDRAIQNGRISEETATRALRRLNVGDDITEDVLEHFGPAVEDYDLAPDVEQYNVTRKMAQPLLRTALTLATTAFSVSSRIVEKAGWLTGRFALVAEQAIGTAIGTLFDTMLGRAEETKSEAKTKINEGMIGLYNDVVDGVVSTVDGFLELLEGVLEPIVTATARGVQAFAESGMSMPSPIPGLNRPSSLHTWQQFLYAAIDPDAAEQGLDGSQNAAYSAASTTRNRITNKAAQVQNTIQAAEDFTGQFGLVPALVDFLTVDETLLTNLLDAGRVLVGIVLNLAGGVVDAFSTGAGIGGLINMLAKNHRGVTNVVNGEQIQ